MEQREKTGFRYGEERIKMDRNTRNRIREGGLTALKAAGLIALGLALSWFLTCCVVKLIMLCFGLTFSWAAATGIWLIICLLRGIFRKTE